MVVVESVTQMVDGLLELVLSELTRVVFVVVPEGCARLVGLVVQTGVQIYGQSKGLAWRIGSSPVKLRAGV